MNSHRHQQLTPREKLERVPPADRPVQRHRSRKLVSSTTTLTLPPPPPRWWIRSRRAPPPCRRSYLPSSHGRNLERTFNSEGTQKSTQLIKRDRFCPCGHGGQGGKKISSTVSPDSQRQWTKENKRLKIKFWFPAVSLPRSSQKDPLSLY